MDIYRVIANHRWDLQKAHHVITIHCCDVTADMENMARSIVA
jgi:hypothetical protein